MERPMRRMLASCFAFLIATAVADASPIMCATIARKVSEKLRLLSAKAPSAGRPRPFDSRRLRRFPRKNGFRDARDAPKCSLNFRSSEADRKQLSNSVVRIARAGGDKGLVLIDGVSGTAQCHTPHLFSLASGQKHALEVPAPNDPFDRCGHAVMALTECRREAPISSKWTTASTRPRISGSPRSNNDMLGMTCSITIRYKMDFVPAESFCAKPDLCALGAKGRHLGAGVAHRRRRTARPRLQPRADAEIRRRAIGPFPCLAAFRRSRRKPLATMLRRISSPFRENRRPICFASARPRPGPANMADWQTFTLVGLYKSDRPVASFVIVRRRSAFASVTVNR